MRSVQAAPLPDGAFLERYQQIEAAAYDCFRIDIPMRMSLAQYLAGFFASPAFRPEGLLLRMTYGCRIETGVIDSCLAGTRPDILIWAAESRAADQIIMQPGKSPIRSWWMARPNDHGGTALYFGSAILPQTGRNGAPRVHGAERLFGPAHRFYARLLLKSAAKRLEAVH